MRIVARNIRDRRLFLDVSQDELARAVGLSRTSVSNIENGRQGMFVCDLLPFAEALLVGPAWLVTEHAGGGS